MPLSTIFQLHCISVKIYIVDLVTTKIMDIKLQDKLLTLPGKMNSPQVFSEVRVAHSLVFSRVATKLQSAYVLVKGGQMGRRMLAYLC